MNKHHTPASTTPARTVFRLSDDEVRDALVAYVESLGATVPAGTRFVWTRDKSESRRDAFLATLGVDHETEQTDSDEGA